MKLFYFALMLVVIGHKTIAAEGILDFSRDSMSCSVKYQINELNGSPANIDFVEGATFILDGKYLPLNVNLDGFSINEKLMYYEEDEDEVRDRTAEYMEVKKNSNGEFRAEMDNDWDTHFFQIHLFQVNDLTYTGVVSLLGDDRYFYHVYCAVLS